MATISRLTHCSFFNSLPLKKRPQGNVSCPNTVCVVSKSTDNASENQAIPIGFLCMPTARTAPAGISWVNQFLSNALRRTFVSNKELGRCKWPTTVSCSLLMMALLVVPNSRQVFHHYQSGSDRFSKGYHSLRCEMAEFLRYGFFSSIQPFQQPVSGARANAGNLASGLSQTQTPMVQRTTGYIQSLICLGVNGSQQIFLTAINADNCSTGFGFRNIDFQGQNQIPNTVDQLQFRIRPVGDWQLSGRVGNRFAPNGQPSGLGHIEVSLPTDWNTLLLVDGEIPLMIGLHCSIGSNHLPKQRTGHLTGQLEFLSDGSVKLVGEFWSRRWFSTIENDLGKPVECLKVVGGDFGEHWILRSNLEFVGSDGFHSQSLYNDTGRKPSNQIPKGAGRQFLRWAKDPAVSLPTQK